MIYLKQNSSNTVILELFQTHEGPEYGFEFIPEWGLELPHRYYLTPDISTVPIRYNEFDFMLSLTGATGATVNNSPISLQAGQYIYNVYADLSTPDFTGPIISTGRMVVEGATGATQTVYL